MSDQTINLTLRYKYEPKDDTRESFNFETSDGYIISTIQFDNINNYQDGVVLKLKKGGSKGWYICGKSSQGADNYSMVKSKFQ